MSSQFFIFALLSDKLDDEFDYSEHRQEERRGISNKNNLHIVLCAEGEKHITLRPIGESIGVEGEKHILTYHNVLAYS